VTTPARPLIAIPARFAASTSALRYAAEVNARALVEAVWRAGGEPATIHPAEPTATGVSARLARFDGVLLPGGGDLAPYRYGETHTHDSADASHHVYAYIVGHGATTTLGMSDDGEPPGTAARPAMAVLRGSGLGDVALVVTRYFGGTLLGTGGLVHAYGDAARAVLATLPREEKVERRELLLALRYASYETARRLVAAQDGSIVEEDFAADVTLRVLLPAARVEAFAAALGEATAGQAQIVDSGSR
jgi:uncharacterized YigZ family protein